MTLLKSLFGFTIPANKSSRLTIHWETLSGEGTKSTDSWAEDWTDVSDTCFCRLCVLKNAGPKGANVDTILCGVCIPVDTVCYLLLFHASYSACVNTSWMTTCCESYRIIAISRALLPPILNTVNVVSRLLYGTCCLGCAGVSFFTKSAWRNVSRNSVTELKFLCCINPS